LFLQFDASAGHLYLDFTDSFGLLVVVDVHKGEQRSHAVRLVHLRCRSCVLCLGKVVNVIHPKDPFFVGFVNMAFDPSVG
jgi:hypothetical protein